MQSEFDEKIVLITGGVGDVNRGIALAFAEAGARVAVQDVSLMAAESVTEKIKTMKRKGLPLQAAVTDPEAVKRIFNQAVAKFGRLDILVAGGAPRRDVPYDRMTAEDWDAVAGDHLRGCFLTTREALVHMKKQGSGKIVTLAAPVPTGLHMDSQANSAAANAGLMGLTRSLAIEFGKYGINVNCAAFDFIDGTLIRETAKRYGMFMEDFNKTVPAQIPLRRLGTVEDVAGVVLFLASEAAAYVTGQVIHVKGGP